MKNFPPWQPDIFCTDKLPALARGSERKFQLIFHHVFELLQFTAPDWIFSFPFPAEDTTNMMRIIQNSSLLLLGNIIKFFSQLLYFKSHQSLKNWWWCWMFMGPSAFGLLRLSKYYTDTRQQAFEKSLTMGQRFFLVFLLWKLEKGSMRVSSSVSWNSIAVVHCRFNSVDGTDFRSISIDYCFENRAEVIDLFVTAL